MINLLGPKLRLAIIGNFVLLVFLGVDFAREILSEGYSSIGNSITVFTSIRITLFIVTASMGVLFLKPVWRSVWRLPVIGKLLSEHIFPDLNGEWEVETRSNWPTINKMRQAAADHLQTPFDVLTMDIAPAVGSFSAEIDQRWNTARIAIRSNYASPLRRSNTLTFVLLPAADDAPKRVTWIYRQQNDRVEATDEDSFLGAAVLEVESHDCMKGVYWTNRSWRRGLNSAGAITLRKKSSKPPK